ncbi:aminoglycoside N(3)-acetyltransferase [Streptosporangium sp. G11]|uniref:aminoglycoside N(3)-acetyltransferase n=1 Tax=Streptosporangium sp. G11 TaxID=3436926 RepID=UPI003EC08CE6
MESEISRHPTRASLAADLRSLGVTPGDTILLHTSLSRLGRVEGGAAAVIAALRDAVGPGGTLVTPAFTEKNSVSSRAYREAVLGMTPEEELRHRARMPAFDRDRTPSHRMGRVSEQLRLTPGAIRSDHPQSSFVAIGHQAADLTIDHELTCHLGPSSPLGRIYDAKGYILLIGVGYTVCTGFHLAEYFLPDTPKTTYRCVINSPDKERKWCQYEDIILDDTDFADIGGALDKIGTVKHGYVGSAPSRLTSMVPAVDFARDWMIENRVTRRPGQ